MNSTIRIILPKMIFISDVVVRRLTKKKPRQQLLPCTLSVMIQTTYISHSCITYLNLVSAVFKHITLLAGQYILRYTPLVFEKYYFDYHSSSLLYLVSRLKYFHAVFVSLIYYKDTRISKIRSSWRFQGLMVVGRRWQMKLILCNHRPDTSIHRVNSNSRN